MVKVRVGGLLTGGWIVIWLLYAYINWNNIEVLSPNEWGDFFAGIFAPLAFLWLVIGYFQQGDELRQNTKALELQAKELRNSVEQQKQLTEVNKKELVHIQTQAEIDRGQVKRVSQPVITQHEATDNRNNPGGIKHVVVRFVNHGKTARNVRVEISCTDVTLNDSLECSSEVLEVWPQEQRHGVWFKFPKNITGKDLTIALKLSYLDVMNEFETSTFVANINDNSRDVSKFSLLEAGSSAIQTQIIAAGS